MNVLGIDPGREKTGLAVVASDGHIRFRAIVETARLEDELEPVLSQWMISRVALGNSTSSASARERIEKRLCARQQENVQIHLVDESHSTLEGRALYFEAYPPRGWKRLLPLSSQVPPVPVDDFAAVVVARRLLFGHPDSGNKKPGVK